MLKYLKGSPTPEMVTVRADDLREALQTTDNAIRCMADQQVLINKLLVTVDDRNKEVLAWADEVSRLIAQDTEQLERLTAFARWCDKQGCAPTDADLEAMLQR